MNSDFYIFQGNNKQDKEKITKLPSPPPWRDFQLRAKTKGERYLVGEEEKELVNAALYLRRPLFVTGKPGTGKSSLAYAVACELGLGEVLLWPITSKSTLQQGLYSYDAIARLRDASLQGKDTDNVSEDMGRYIRLGALGTAFLPSEPARPRVLLIDEIDKSDIDFPNDLLNIFEEGEFEIPELSRLSKKFQDIKVFPYDSDERVKITEGHVRCNAFPFVVITSNGEREFPPAFLRRCLQLQINPPTPEKLNEIIGRHFESLPERENDVKKLLDEFVKRRDHEKKDMATDQLLNAVYLVIHDVRVNEQLRAALFKSLSESLYD